MSTSRATSQKVSRWSDGRRCASDLFRPKKSRKQNIRVVNSALMSKTAAGRSAPCVVRLDRVPPEQGLQPLETELRRSCPRVERRHLPRPATRWPSSRTTAALPGADRRRCSHSRCRRTTASTLGELTNSTRCGPRQVRMTSREAATRHRCPVALRSLFGGRQRACAVIDRLPFGERQASAAGPVCAAGVPHRSGTRGCLSGVAPPGR